MVRKLLLNAALGLAMGLYGFAADEPKPEAPPTLPEERLSIQVYRLKNVEPNDALQAFNALVGQVKQARSRSPREFPENNPGGGQPGGRGAGKARGVAPGPGGFAPDGSDVFVTPYAPTQKGSVSRALADPRTRSLIVRGTEKDLQVAADIVALLDTAEGKTLPGVKTVKAFRLQHLDAEDLASMLHLLDPQLGYRLAPVGRMKMLLATGSDAQMKELTDAVQKLDIPAEMK